VEGVEGTFRLWKFIISHVQGKIYVERQRLPSIRYPTIPVPLAPPGTGKFHVGKMIGTGELSGRNLLLAGCISPALN